MKSFVQKSDGEHQAWFWPGGAEQPGAEQPGYWDPDASASNLGAVLPAPDADDGYPEQHCSGTSAGSYLASASVTPGL